MPNLVSAPSTHLFDDDWFSRQWGPSLLAPFTSSFFKRAQNELASSIHADIAEDDKAFTITADLPGIHKDNINVTINENNVTIRAERKREEPEETEKVAGRKTRLLQLGRQYGTFLANFILPSAVNSSDTSAKYENGLLTLKLPKQAASSAHQVPIN